LLSLLGVESDDDEPVESVVADFLGGVDSKPGIGRVRCFGGPDPAGLVPELLPDVVVVSVLSNLAFDGDDDEDEARGLATPSSGCFRLLALPTLGSLATCTIRATVS
jgi:hypothetical protein